MRASLLGPSSVLAVLASTFVGMACSATSATSGFASEGTGASAGSEGNGAGTNSSTMSNGGNPTISGLNDAGTGGGGVSSAYAHTNTDLFRIDPSQQNLALTHIGAFDCIGTGAGQDTSMTDLAVDSTGDVWAISAHNVYKLTLPLGTGPVHCATTYSLTGVSNNTFYGLTFAPVGVIDPAKEVLVASNTAGQLWELDVSTMPVTGTQRGTFGTVPTSDGHGHTYKYPNTPWELSGDIVFLANNGNPLAFATVRDCQSPPSSSNCDSSDTLIEIDTTKLTPGTQVVTKTMGGIRGMVTKSATCNDTVNSTYGSMYGIAAYQDKVFGFSHQGYVVTIDNNDATACLALQTTNDSWAGAAITTVAPVVPPTTQ